MLTCKVELFFTALEQFWLHVLPEAINKSHTGLSVNQTQVARVVLVVHCLNQ